MANNDLKKLSRIQILEMLLEQTQRVEELEQLLSEKDKLITQLQSSSDKQENNIVWEEAGSLAEAALQINNVFLQADKAAAQYLDYVKKFAKTAEQMHVKQYSEKKKEAESILMDARRQADEILDEAYRYAEEIIKQAKEGRCTDE